MPDPHLDPAIQPGRLKVAADTIRQTTKWILTMAAGLGSVLVAGLRFGDLGHLTAWTPTFWTALVGVSAALAAVSFVLAMASRVLTVRYQTLRQVVAELAGPSDQSPELPLSVTGKLIRAIQQEDDELYHGVADDPRDLFAQIRDLNTTRRNERSALTSDDAMRRPSSILELRQAAERTADFADYWETCRRFRALLWSLAVAAVVIVAGVLTFALAINRSAGPRVAIDNAPLGVEVIFSPAGQQWAIHALGCRPTKLSAVAIGGTLDAAEVVVDNESGCRAGRFVVTADRGVVIPVVTTITSSP